jgi:signal transduction histidine kinase
MQTPAVPDNEAARVQSLRALAILDTEAEERFDRLTRIAARTLDLPIALVSLIDSDRQWFKSRVGLSARETPRSISFCGHAILSDDVFVVPDARQDERFRDNPLVTGGPRIRFYAGAQLRDRAGRALGTLCALGRRPRKLRAREQDVLRDLASVVEREFAVTTAIDHACASAAIANELALPMSKLAGTAHLLALTQLTRQQRMFANTIALSADHIFSLATEIIERGGVPQANLEPFSLASLLEECVEMFVPQAQAQRTMLTHTLAPALPRILVGCEPLLRRALIQLLDDAIRRTHDGEVELSCHAPMTEQTLATVVFRIRDTGSRIWNTKQAFELCRVLITCMGGELAHEQAPQGESIVRITCPVRIAV